MLVSKNNPNRLKDEKKNWSVDKIRQLPKPTLIWPPTSYFSRLGPEANVKTLLKMPFSEIKTFVFYHFVKIAVLFNPIQTCSNLFSSVQIC